MTDPGAKNFFLASVLAGPSVLFFMACATLWESIPDPIAVPTGPEIVFVPFLLLLSALVGFLPAMAAAGVGTLLIAVVGEHFPVADEPLSWTVIGALLGGAVPFFFEAGSWVTFAFAAAGATSGAICCLDLRSGAKDGYRRRP